VRRWRIRPRMMSLFMCGFPLVHAITQCAFSFYPMEAGALSAWCVCPDGRGRIGNIQQPTTNIQHPLWGARGVGRGAGENFKLGTSNSQRLGKGWGINAETQRAQRGLWDGALGERALPYFPIGKYGLGRDWTTGSWCGRRTARGRRSWCRRAGCRALLTGVGWMGCLTSRAQDGIAVRLHLPMPFDSRRGSPMRVCQWRKAVEADRGCRSRKL